MFLAIDTSSATTFVAVYDPATQRCWERSLDGSAHELLRKSVSELLQQAGCRVTLLKGLVYGDGPGSFTGLNIGLAFAKGLVSAAGLPLFVVPTFMAAAWEFRHHDGPIVVLADARRGEVFAGIYRWLSGKLVEIQPVGICTPLQLMNQVNSQPALWVQLGQGLTGLPDRVHFPQHLGRSLIDLQQLMTAQPTPLAAAVMPNYLRAVSAKTVAEQGK